MLKREQRRRLAFDAQRMMDLITAVSGAAPIKLAPELRERLDERLTELSKLTTDEIVQVLRSGAKEVVTSPRAEGEESQDR